MPVVSYSPYSDAANAGQGVGNALAQMALQVPQLKAQQMMLKAQLSRLPYEFALMQAQTAANQGRGKEYSARADLYKAQTEKATDEGKARKALETQYGPQGNVFGVGNNPLQSAHALAALQALPGAGLGQGQKFDPQQAAVASGLAQLARPVVAPSGSTVIGPAGTLLGQAAYTLNPQQQRFAPQLGPGFGNNPPTQQTPMANNPNVKPQTNSSADPLVNLAMRVAGAAGTPKDLNDLWTAIQTIKGNQGVGTNKPPVKITSPEEYNALTSGTVYIDPQGNTRTKP